MKKIIHLLASNKFSGAENVVCQIIETHKDDPNYKMVYCSSDGDIKSSLKIRNIDFLPLNKLNYSSVKKIINEFEPDIIHAHDFRASVISAICAPRKVKIISQLHNNPPFIKKWCIKSLLYKLCTFRFSSIIVVSKAVKEEAVFLKDSEKVCVIDNFLNKESIIKKTGEVCCEKEYDISFVGRLSYQKDPIRVLKIIKDVSSRKNDVSSIIIGDGEMMEECEKYIEQNSIKNVELKGFVKNPYSYLKHSKVCIMPSRFEGFGLVAVESLICGTPVLNSGVGGLASIFSNHQELICNTDEEYVNKIIEFIDSDKIMNFSDIIDKYTDKEKWKFSLDKIYNER